MLDLHLPSGLSRQILFWFLLLALLPLGIISWLSYQTAREQMQQSTGDALEDVTNLQSLRIQTTFQNWLVQLQSESEKQSNSRFLSALIDARQSTERQSTEQVAKTFTQSFRWATIVDEMGTDLATFNEAFNYYDVLLINAQGEILFTVTQADDLGQNLFQGPLKHTKFAQAALQSFQSGQPVFSDLEYYAPVEHITGFMVAPLLDEVGEKSGVIALQLSPSQIDQLIGQNTQFGDTGKRYLIGADLTLRTKGALGADYPILRTPVETMLTHAWQRQANMEKQPESTQNEQVHHFIGVQGRTMLGVFSDIHIAGVHWGYISEIETDEAFAAAARLQQLTLWLISVTLILVFVIALPVTRSIVQPILQLSEALLKVGRGDLAQNVKVRSNNELGALAEGFNAMIAKLKTSSAETEQQRWLQTGMNQLNVAMEGDQDLATLARNTIGFLCRYLEAQIGAMYIINEQQIKLMGSYAFTERKGFHNTFNLGQGMVGQCALEQQTLTISPAPADYFVIASGLGEVTPNTVVVSPLLWNNQVLAVVEFGMFGAPTTQHHEFLKSVATRIAIAVQTAQARAEMQALLARTQSQAEELQTREEELSSSNDTLAQQAQDLRHASEAQERTQVELEEKNNQLQVQQEELRVANEDLEEKARALETSRAKINQKNQDLQHAQQTLEDKAQDLTTSSRYKSEFLANMSHELRTPLNSMLILSQLLAENKQANLTDKQVEFANTIHDSGSDLLNLINDILDLSKIESGKMDVHIETMHLDAFVSEFQRKFGPLAANKGLDFRIETQGAPTTWHSDAQKLSQVVKNLLSNAMKFTQQGQVTLHLGAIPKHLSLHTLTTETGFTIAVSDTGIGIPEEKFQAIFQAFKQVDGTTSRHYGGTGLGLSISRELTKLLGGEIHVRSQAGEGSCFTLYMPTRLTISPTPEPEPKPEKALQSVAQTAKLTQHLAAAESVVTQAVMMDDRAVITPDDRSLLIIEDDGRFSAILAEAARDRGFKVLLADTGESGLQLAQTYQPSGIVLDIGLPGMDGWQVLAQLKTDAETRHIPVHFMSASDSTLEAMKNGAVGFLTKPVSVEDMTQALNRIAHIIDRPVKRLLLVEDNPAQQQTLIELIGNGDVETTVADSGRTARKLLAENPFDCIVLDLGLPDMCGTELLETIRTSDGLREVPVVIYTGKELSPDERAILNRYAQSIIIKDVRSPERLLDDTTLFLHRVEANMPLERRRMIRMLHDSESVFQNRKVLLVDDDMRNVFALSALLQEKAMQVIIAHNGVEALAKLEEHADVAIILMDIMMPEMDGYEAIKKIRAQAKFRETPIIALTAKAMKGDRIKCIDAGASDYSTKPVDTEKLLSMMRVWLYQ